MNQLTSIHQAIDLPDQSGRLIVLDWSANMGGSYRNLLRVNATGDVVWTAELPGSAVPDCFVAVRMEGNTIRANTWSGYLVILDQQTGQVLSSEFTK